MVSYCEMSLLAFFDRWSRFVVILFAIGAAIGIVINVRGSVFHFWNDFKNVALEMFLSVEGKLLSVIRNGEIGHQNVAFFWGYCFVDGTVLASVIDGTACKDEGSQKKR